MTAGVRENETGERNLQHLIKKTSNVCKYVVCLFHDLLSGEIWQAI